MAAGLHESLGVIYFHNQHLENRNSVVLDEIPVIVDAETFTLWRHDITINDVEFALSTEFEIIEWIECLEKFAVADGKGWMQLYLL